VPGRPFSSENNPQRKKRNPPRPPPPAVLGGLHAGGRPTVYQDTFPEQLRRLRLLMMTKEQIAQFFGVEVSTITLWCKKHPEFNAAWAAGGDKIDGEVMASLAMRAIGFERETKKIVTDANGTILKVEITTNYYPPETNANGLWMSNRRKNFKLRRDPAEEREETTINITGGLPDDD
jgi:hypothetical protein